MDGGPTRVSIITGLAVRRDAISNVARQQLDAVERHLRRQGRPYAVKLYAQGSDADDPRIHLASTPADLVADDHFHLSDVILYQFGVFYALFDSIHLAPRTARVVVNYQGITPPKLVPKSDRETVHRSYRQAVNLLCADRVFTGSRHLHRELIGMGVPAAKLGHVPYAVPFALEQRLQKTWSSGTLKLLYLGRFSPAKGLRELIAAFGRLRREGFDAELSLVGSKRFTGQGFLEELDRLVERNGVTASVRTHFDVPAGELTGHLERADVLVMPSYHEGFCVPVIEALSFGCFPVTSDAAALPETTGGLGLLCPPGDPAALAGRIREFDQGRRLGRVPTAAHGELPVEDWRRRVAEHLAGFGREAFEQRLIAELFHGLCPADGEAKPALLERRRALFAEAGEVPKPLGPALDADVLARDGCRPRTGYGKFVNTGADQ